MGKPSLILLIDDERQNISAMSRILSKENVEILSAADGVEGYEMAVAHKPDIVLSDVMMPKMDGFELCKQMKANPELMFTPVILVTGLEDFQSRLKGISSGADDYLNKPINAAELLARVRTALKVRNAHDAVESAQRTMGRLTEYAESMLQSFDPLKFEQRTMEAQLVSQILIGQVVERNRPAGVLVGSPTGGGAFAGRFYYTAAGEVRLFFESAIVAPPDTADRHFPAPGIEFGNFPASGNTQRLSAELFAAIGELRNYAAVSNGSMAVVAVNLAGAVTRFDADILKNLSLYLMFFENLVAGIKRTDEAFHYTVDSLVRAAEANDEDTGNHILRVNEYAKLLAVEMGLPEKLVHEIYSHAQMHDVGKLHINPAILRKPGPLSPTEWETMKRHTQFGAKILGDHPRFAIARNIALTHHERYDGTGYPNGLRGEEIPIEGRIVMIADIYDALRCMRSYKPSLDHAQAVKIICVGDGRTMPSHFDPLVLSAFLNRAAELDFIFSKMK
ncbi:MAG: HD domain-containing phosphohydrolase [Myxococcota bacterium]|jgi:response regulator RpfG family c-di-GMP phosphodiesterase